MTLQDVQAHHRRADPDGPDDQVNVESAGEAVAKGVVYAIKGTHIEGGDIFMKRAVLKSTVTTEADITIERHHAGHQGDRRRPGGARVPDRGAVGDQGPTRARQAGCRHAAVRPAGWLPHAAEPAQLAMAIGG